VVWEGNGGAEPAVPYPDPGFPGLFPPIEHFHLVQLVPPVLAENSFRGTPDRLGAPAPLTSGCRSLISIDGDPAPLVDLAWDDADSGEDWPGLADQLRVEAVKRGWTSPSIAFAEAIGIEIVEPDAPLGMAHGVISHEIKALSPAEPSVRKRSLAITVFDTISDGTYTVSCTLSRDP
jgi:hypothetical protein